MAVAFLLLLHICPSQNCTFAEEFDLLHGVGLIFSQGYMSNCAPLLEAPNKPLKVDQEGSIPLGYQMEHPVFKTVETLGGSLQESQATLLS